MIVRKSELFIALDAEDGSAMRVRHANRGEPYREGVELDVSDCDGENMCIFLQRYEAIELRNLLNRLYPETGT